MRSMETATVVVAPAPVAITQPPRHKLTQLKFSFAPVAKSSPARKAKPGKKKLTGGCGGYVLEDVPHLTDYLPELKSYPSPLQDHPAYSVVKQYFVKPDETVAKKIVVHKSSARGTHFRLAGPRRRVYFEPDEVRAAIVTCGGVCPGLNTVIRELVRGLHDMYGVTSVSGIEGGFRGFYARNTVELTPRSVDGIHRRGGTALGASRGGHDTAKIVDSIQDRGLNQVYVVGGDGAQRGAAAIHEEARRRGLKCAVVGVPKAVDNDVAVVDRSLGFDTAAVEEARRAISAAHVEAECAEHGVGVVKLMGRDSGFIAVHATLASGDVDCCLVPESPFYLDGDGGLLQFVEKRLRDNGHMVIVVAEGAGQDLVAKDTHFAGAGAGAQYDASGNKELLDVGLWLSEKIKEHFKKKKPGFPITLKYIDPTYMIRAVPPNASDNVYCTMLAHDALHGAMAGYTGFTVGPVNGEHAYIPFYRVTEKQNKVAITDRMWARVLCSTNQPCFLKREDVQGAGLELDDDEEPHMAPVEGVRNLSLCDGAGDLCNGAASRRNVDSFAC